MPAEGTANKLAKPGSRLIPGSCRGEGTGIQESQKETRQDQVKLDGWKKFIMWCKKHLKTLKKIKFHRWYINLSIRNYILIYRSSRLSETPDRHLAGISADPKTPEYRTCKTNQHGVQVPCSFQDSNFKNNYMPSLPKVSALPSARPSSCSWLWSSCLFTS